MSFVASTIQELERLQLQMQRLLNDILYYRHDLEIRQKSEKIKHMSIMGYQLFKFHHSYAKLYKFGSTFAVITIIITNCQLRTLPSCLIKVLPLPG